MWLIERDLNNKAKQCFFSSFPFLWYSGKKIEKRKSFALFEFYIQSWMWDIVDIEKKDRLKHLLTIANSYLALHTRTIHVWVSFSCFFFFVFLLQTMLMKACNFLCCIYMLKTTLLLDWNRNLERMPCM